MAFDHIQTPLTFHTNGWAELPHVTKGVLDVLLDHYNLKYHISYPTVPQLQIKVGASERQVQRALLISEQGFFLVRDSLGSLADLEFLPGMEILKRDKTAYILPDSLLFKAPATLKLFQHALSLWKGRHGRHPRVPQMAIEGAKNGIARVSSVSSQGCHPRHLNYMIERYQELSSSLIEKIQRPQCKTPLILEKEMPGPEDFDPDEPFREMARKGGEGSEFAKEWLRKKGATW